MHVTTCEIANESLEIFVEILRKYNSVGSTAAAALTPAPIMTYLVTLLIIFFNLDIENIDQANLINE